MADSIQHPQAHDHSGGLEPFVLTAEQVAHVLGIGRSTVFELNSMGLLPRAIRFGRSVRWDRDGLKDWIAAGAPPRDRWEDMLKARRSGKSRGNGA